MSYEDDATFCQLSKLVVKSEAGFVDNPHDSGGPTKYGVAWVYNAAWLSTHGYTRETMRNLKLEDAYQCFYERYWLRSEGNGLTDLDLAYEHFDAAVNCGTGAAASFLKLLPVDPKTFDFSNGKNKDLGERLLLNYSAIRLRYYTHCRKDLKIQFEDGWINRMADVLDNCANKIPG